MQMPVGSEGGPAPSTQWAETFMLQVADSLGYSLPAQISIELITLLDSLRDNVKHEKDLAASAMQDLLINVLTPMQAARYLLASHPFSWNGLAFGKACVSSLGSA